MRLTLSTPYLTGCNQKFIGIPYAQMCRPTTRGATPKGRGRESQAGSSLTDFIGDKGQTESIDQEIGMRVILFEQTNLDVDVETW